MNGSPFYLDPHFEFSFEIAVDLHNFHIAWCYDQTVIYVAAHNHIPSVVNTQIIFRLFEL